VSTNPDYSKPYEDEKGMFSLLAGREGTGKSTVMTDRIARLTRGQLDGVHRGRPRSAIIVATEDSWQHTLVPRLMAAGADLDRVLRLQVQRIDLGECELSLPEDIDAVREVIPEHDVAMVVLDPLISRLSRGLDTHRDAEVRLALEPLAKLADDTSVALIGLIHVSKAMTKDPLTAVMGSRGFVAVARSVLFAAADPADRSNRVLSVVKCNVGPDDSSGKESLAYKVEGATVDTPEGPAETSRIVWTGVAVQGVRELLAVGDGERGASRQDAEEFLREILAGGPVPSDDVVAEAKEAGITTATLRRAKDSIGVRAAKQGGQFGGVGARWYWKLPPQDAQQPHKVITYIAERLVGEVSALCDPTPPEALDSTDRPAQTNAYRHTDGVDYLLGDLLPDGRKVLDVEGPILSKVKVAPLSAEEAIR
jgi:hypothetical protein